MEARFGRDRPRGTRSHRRRRVQNSPSHSLHHGSSFPQPLTASQIPRQASGKSQAPDYPPCLLGLFAFEPIDAKVPALTFVGSASVSPLEFSTQMPECCRTRNTRTSRVGKSSMFPHRVRFYVELRLTFPHLHINNSRWGSGVSTELPDGRRARNMNEKRTSSSTRLNGDQPRTREKEGRREHRAGFCTRPWRSVCQSCKCAGSTVPMSISQMGHLGVRILGFLARHATFLRKLVPTALNLGRSEGSRINPTRRMNDFSEYSSPATPAI